ncbi:MAG: hypothetical protein Q9Q13_00195 [Acidobacteriota bacterium]|nr:hypothetical protein [Acidobacteriota bacterium]
MQIAIAQSLSERAGSELGDFPRADRTLPDLRTRLRRRLLSGAAVLLLLAALVGLAGVVALRSSLRPTRRTSARGRPGGPP